MDHRQTRDVQGDRAGEAVATPHAAEALAPSAQRIIDLQRSAGNRAVAAMLSRAPAVAAPADPRAAAEEIKDAFHGSTFSEDEEKALAAIRHQPPDAVAAIRTAYRTLTGATLEDEFRSYVSAAQLKEAMAWIRPALNLEERLRLSIDPHVWGLFSTENEGAMLAELKKASRSELDGAAGPTSPVRALLKDRLNAKEYFQASKLLDPKHLYDAAVEFIRSAPGFDDDEAGTYDVILDLSLADRRRLWQEQEGLFSFMDADEKASAQTMCLGTEADALKERLKIATSGPGTDDDAVKAIMAHTADAAQREKEIKAALASGIDAKGKPLTPEDKLALQNELFQLGGIADGLLKGEATDETSFLGMLHDDVSEAEFQSFAGQISASAFARAKQQVLDALHWYGDDEDSVYAAFDRLVGTIDLPAEQTATLSAEARAKAQQEATRVLRQRLLDDKEVKAALESNLSDDELAKVRTMVSADSYQIALQRLNDAYAGLDTDEEGIFKVLADMSEADRKRMVKEQPAIYFKLVQEPTALNKDEQAIAKAIIDTGVIPTDKALDWAMGGFGDGTKEEMVVQTFERLSDEERAEYRMGYFLHKGGTLEALTPADVARHDAAKAKFAALYERLDAELGTDDLERALDALVGPVTLQDFASEEGRLIAARMLRERVMSKGGHRDDDTVSSAVADPLSESGGVADDAQTRFLTAYESAMADGKISPAELAVLMSFESEQAGAYEDYVATVDQVGAIAATAAAIVVGIVITVASDGALGPVAAELIKDAGGPALIGGVAGAITRVGVHETIGGSHFDALSTEGGSDALAGAVDAALPGLTKGLAGSLSASFGRLVGLGGDALAAEATTGVLLASNAAIEQAGKRAVIGGVREMIQGMLAGAAGEVVVKVTDEKTWRQSIARVIETLGEAIVRGGGIGAATGAVMGATLDALTAVVGVSRVRTLVTQLEQAGVDGQRLASLPLGAVRALGQVDQLLNGGKIEEAAKLLATLRRGKLDPAEIEGIWKQLGLSRGGVPSLEEVLPEWKISTVRQAEKAVEALAKRLPGHTFEHVGTRIRINGQIEATAEYLAWLEANHPDQFAQLLAGTKALDAVGGKFEALDEATRKLLTALTKGDGLRLVFGPQLMAELEQAIQKAGIASELGKKFNLSELSMEQLARLRQVLRDSITQWDAETTRLCALYALDRATNIESFAERIEFFRTYLDYEYDKVNQAFQDAIAAKVPEPTARANLGLKGEGKLKDAIAAKVLADAASGGAAQADAEFARIVPAAAGHVGAGAVDPDLAEAELIAATRAQKPKFAQLSAAVYHQFKHPQIPEAALLPPGFPLAASKEAQYFALVDLVVQEGTPSVSPRQFGGRTIVFQKAFGDDVFQAIVRIGPDGEMTLSTMFNKTPK